MNLERLRWGDWIAGIAGLDLLLVTFRAWYKISGGDGRITAWNALDHGRFLLIATGVVGVFLLFVKMSDEAPQLSFPPGWIAVVAGFACTVYAAYRLATPPADILDADIGLFLGLASALGVTIGGLMSAREAAPETFPAAEEVATEEAPAPAAAAEPLGALVPDSGRWSPASPLAAGGWNPSTPVAPISPPTGGADRPLRAGDHVALTTGGLRFPAGTVGEVIEVFAGGVLVEVKSPDGLGERFEVPESAFERVLPGAAGAAAAAAAVPAAPPAESWTPAMPAPAGEDWGFDEAQPGAAEPGAAGEEAGDDAKPAKVPWWKREIGGGKKKRGDSDPELAEAAVAAAAGAVALDEPAPGAETDAEPEQPGESKPGFFKRLFGGGGAKAADDAPETIEDDAEPAVHEQPPDEPQPLAAAPVPTIVEPEPPALVPEPPAPEPEPLPAPPAPEPTAPAPEPPAPEPEPPAPAPEPEPPAPAPEPEPPAPVPEPPAPEPDPEPVAVEPEPAPPAPEAALEPAPEPEAAEEKPKPKRKRSSGSRKVPKEALAASEPEPSVPEPAPEPEAAAPEPEPAPEPPAPEPTPEPDPEPPAPEPTPEPEAAAPTPEPEPEPAEEKPKPKRKRSSGSRKVPKEALAAAAGDAASADSPPKVGDAVALRVAGGKYDVGARGTVVDVFSAGVIVELSDPEGRTERLDLPFEAVGPADA